MQGRGLAALAALGLILGASEEANAALVGYTPNPAILDFGTQEILGIYTQSITINYNPAIGSLTGGGPFDNGIFKLLEEKLEQPSIFTFQFTPKDPISYSAVFTYFANSIRIEIQLSGTGRSPTTTPIPVPPALALFATGLAAVGYAGRKRKRKPA